jgi:hypothetical protein
MASSPSESNGKMGPNKIQNNFQNYHKTITNTFADGFVEDPSPLPMKEKRKSTPIQLDIENDYKNDGNEKGNGDKEKGKPKKSKMKDSKVSFSDKGNKIFEVESYKNYNASEDKKPKGCHCSSF